MKPYPTGSNSGSAKTSDGAEQSAAMAPGYSASAWEKEITSSNKRDGAPQPPPVWTRYIDSRLKQFCTR